VVTAWSEGPIRRSVRTNVTEVPCAGGPIGQVSGALWDGRRAREGDRHGEMARCAHLARNTTVAVSEQPDPTFPVCTPEHDTRRARRQFAFASSGLASRRPVPHHRTVCLLMQFTACSESARSRDSPMRIPSENILAQLRNRVGLGLPAPKCRCFGQRAPSTKSRGTEPACVDSDDAGGRRSRQIALYRAPCRCEIPGAQSEVGTWTRYRKTKGVSERDVLNETARGTELLTNGAAG
jgi:hypothetical protein